MARKKETESQFLRRIDRTGHKLVKDGGPTRAELLRAIDIKIRRNKEAEAVRGASSHE